MEVYYNPKANNIDQMDAQLTATHSERLRQRMRWIGKKLLVFMFSQVGLTCLVVGYAIMGGFAFQALEATNEKKSRAAIMVKRSKYVKELWDVTEKLNILFRENWTATADVIFQKFQTAVYESVKDEGWDGMETQTDDTLEWTYAGSLLFSVTVITTIGYGHLTPRTWEGRVVLMVYALIGIPLTLLCLANVGSLLANCFRALYSKVILCGLCREHCCKKKNKGVLLQPHAHPAIGNQPSRRGANDVMLATFDENPHSTEYGDRRKNPKQKVRVPIFVCLFLMIGYICLGAFMFTIWEEEWNFLVGSYFCFVTLSTIGFGDYVPGHSQHSWDNQVKRVSCTVYLIFGLAMLAMCFDLMQEEVRVLCRKFARAIGIIDDREEGNAVN